MKRVSVLGLGYVGLPTAIIAAQYGYEVCGFDLQKEKVHLINNGTATIFEPELSNRLWNVLCNKTFKAFTDLQYADYFVIAVQTPFKKNKTADLSFVFSAADLIAKRIMKGNLIILESTVPVETTEKIATRVAEISGLIPCKDFFIAFCPERILPGKIFKEVINNNRVIGGICKKSCEFAKSFYSKFVKGFIHITDDKTAEVVKLVENSSRDLQIAFANQIASICSKVGIDTFRAIELANNHPRVNILQPGCGVGGHCIAVDPYFLIEQFPNDTDLLRMARSINELRPQTIVEEVLRKIEDVKNDGVENPRVISLGLTFKADVDDIRESPALKIVNELKRRHHGIDLVVYDHKLSSIVIRNLGLVTSRSILDGILESDIVVILVKHKEFSFIKIDAFKDKIVVDPCGLLHDIYANKAKVFFEKNIKCNCSEAQIKFLHSKIEF